MGDVIVDLKSLLFPGETDVLANGAKKEFKSDAIDGKVVGLVVGPHWVPHMLYLAISMVVEAYEELTKKGTAVVFVYASVGCDQSRIDSLAGNGHGDEVLVLVDQRPDEESFQDVIKKLPAGWLAVPLGSSEVSTTLEQEFKFGNFSLSFVGADGKVATKNGWPIVLKWGADAFPFTEERIGELEAEVDALKENQSLKSLLVTDHRDFLIRSDGTQVKVAELEGKPLVLYFSAHWCSRCRSFTPALIDLSEKLNFEVVFISGDVDEEEFRTYFADMPCSWLAVPFTDQQAKKLLNNIFEVEGHKGMYSPYVCETPTVVTLNSQGKTVQADTVKLVRKTLEDVLATKDRDYVTNHAGEEVKISSLRGKTVGIYFSGHWCTPCQGFTPKLVEVYKELQRDDKPFEIVFVSIDKDQESFKSYYGTMPWLAVPFSDREAKSDLFTYFEVEGIATLVILTPDGTTVTVDGRSLVDTFGARGFPFTSEREQELEQEKEGEIESLPKEVTIPDHPHPLVLTRSPYAKESYGCDVCGNGGRRWAYHCDECGFDVHTECATNPSLKEESAEGEIESLPKEVTIPDHPHPLVLTRSPYAKESYGCDVCGNGGRRWAYRCDECGFDVHTKCATNPSLKEESAEGEIESLPKEVTIPDHPHPLVLTRSPYAKESYGCDVCGNGGRRWAYRCDECGFDVHTECATNPSLTEESAEEEEDHHAHGEGDGHDHKAGSVCEGEVCRRA